MPFGGEVSMICAGTVPFGVHFKLKTLYVHWKQKPPKTPRGYPGNGKNGYFN